MKKNIERDFEESVKKLSPEYQLLLWSIRVDDKLTDLAKNILYSKNVIFNFESFKRLAFSKGVLSLLYKKMKTLNLDKLNSELIHVFKEAYMEILARNIKLTNKLGTLSGILENNDLDMIAFKGPALGLIAYGDIAYRSSADLDILVPNNQFPEVIEVIRKSGFSPRFPFREKVVKYLQRSWRDIHLEKDFYHIDIHQQFAQGPSFLRATSEDLESIVKIKLDTQEVGTLSAEDSLVTMAVHCSKDGFSSLKHFRDITGIILNNPKLNWERVLSSAKAKKCFRILLISLGLSQKFSGLLLPSDIEQKIKSRFVKNKIKTFSERIFSFRFDNESIYSYISFGGALDTESARLRFFLWYLFFPSPQLHKKIFKLPSWLFFLIPLLSPFYLSFSHLFRLLRSRMSHPGK